MKSPLGQCLVVATLALVVLHPSDTEAQRRRGAEGGGAFRGYVVNGTTGARVEGAIVVFVNQETNREEETTTREDGTFSRMGLELGSYKVRVSKEGFKPVELGGLTLSSDQRGITIGSISIAPDAVAERPATPDNTAPSSLRDVTPPTIQITSPQIERGLGLSVAASKTVIHGQAADESGINEVLVQGMPASLDEMGNFSAETLLKIGENKITVTAIDIHGNRSARDFTIIRETQPLPSPAEPPPPSSKSEAAGYYALVIGNNAYLQLPQLKTAEHDATVIEGLLRGRYGFETKLLLNANRQQIFAAISEYRRKLDANANLLIYYAGHGYYDREVEKAYWIPIDGGREDNANWISADDITVNIKGVPARHILIVSDSCYSGTIVRGVTPNLSAPLAREKYLQKMAEGKSRTLLASGGNEPVADGGGEGHSIFANALIRGLTQTDKSPFTAEELFYDYIRESVAGRSDQTPEYNPLRNSGHESGDFVFTRKR